MKIVSYFLPSEPVHGESFALTIPWNAKVRDVRSTENKPTMHLEVTEGSHEIERTFYLFESNEEFDELNMEFVGTTWVRARNLFMHLYELRLLG